MNQITQRIALSALAALVLAPACALEPFAPDNTILDESKPGAPHASSLYEGFSACRSLERGELVDGLVIVEGDMVVGTEDELIAECAAQEAGTAPKGIGTNNLLRRWDSGIVPFEIHPELPDQLRITDAITEWESNTGLFFIPRNPAVHDDFVLFLNSDRCNADFGRRGGEQHIRLSTGKRASEVAGFGIAPGSSDVYAWYTDEMASFGSSNDPDDKHGQYQYGLPPGYAATQIVGMAIATSTSHVYTWYSHNSGPRLSIGISDDLDAHAAPVAFSLPPGYSPSEIMGMAIDSSDDVYTWYNHNGSITRSVGTSTDLDAHEPPIPVTGIRASSRIVGMAIAPSTNLVYTWYSDNRATIGTSTALDSEDNELAWETPVGCGTGAVVHEMGHAIGLKHEQSRCDRDDFVHVFYNAITPGKEGNFDKHCVGYSDFGDYDLDSVMHYESFGFSANGAPTILGIRNAGVPVNGMIATAISSDDKTYSWWDDGTVTSGQSWDLEMHRSRTPFEVAEGYTMMDIAGMAIAKSDDRVYTFYADGMVSVGTTTDLEEHVAPYAYSLPPGYASHDILDIAIANNDHVYVWYNDGNASSGTTDVLDAHIAPYAYTLPPGYSVAEILGIAIATSDEVYAWYNDGKASTGNSSNLDASAAPFDYRDRGKILQSSSVLSPGDIWAVDQMY